MTKLGTARLRLEKAIDRVDKAITRRTWGLRGEERAAPRAGRAKAEGQQGALKGDLETLRGDHRKLSAALREAQENYAASQVVTEAVAGRLEAAIGKLKGVLES